MTYEEAVEYRFINEYLVGTHVHINRNGYQSLIILKPCLISSPHAIGEVFYKMVENGGDNKKALIDLDLLNDTLKVYVIALINQTELFHEDLDEYLKPIRDANLN